MACISIVTQRLLGHLLPILEVGIELKRRGHCVHIHSHTSHQTMIEETGLSFRESGWDKFPDLFLLEGTSSFLTDFTNEPPDLIICDSSLGPPSYVAEMLHIPWVSFQTTIPLPDDQLQGTQTVNNRRRRIYEKKINQVRTSFGLPGIQDYRRTRGDFAGLSPFLHLILVYPELINDWKGIPDNTIISGACSYKPVKTNTINSCNIERVVTVCTTSVDRDDYKEITEQYLNATIEAFGGDISTQVYLCHQQFASRTYLSLPPNVKVVGSYPSHHHVMPYSDVIITHGGCSTLQNAMFYGVPMIIIPMGADHQSLAERCKSLGIAMIINKNQVTKGNLLSLTNDMMSNLKYRDEATQLSERLKRSTPSEVKSADHIERLLNMMIKEVR